MLLLAIHVAAALCAPLLVKAFHRRAFWVLALAPAAAAVWALVQTSAVQAGEGPVEVTAWVGQLHMDLAFRLDTLAWFMTLLVGGVGALVMIYSSGYFSTKAQHLGRFSGVLVAFAGSMLGLVVTDDLLMLYVFWELTTVTSYLLIGHYAERKPSRRAAMQAIIITTAGGLAMLVGVVILGESAGTYRISEVVASPPAGTAVTAAVVLLLVGAATKSAMIPLHFWLPSAMAAPTPVSAYLHAAAMVKAGIYLVARFAPAFADLAVWRWIVIVLGAGSLLVGGYRALRQYDLKLVLAFGTVSQLGLLLLLVGLGSRAAALAGLAMLGAHAMFKAALFLTVGVVDVATGTRDLRRLSGVGRELPVTAAVGALATASMIGLPPFAGFVGKEAAIEALLGDTSPVGVTVLVAFVVGSVLTVAYGLRFWWGAFATKPAADDGGPDQSGYAVPLAEGERTQPVHISHPTFVLVVPAAVLALLGLAVALVPAYGEELLSPHANTYPGEPGHLVLWAGITPALLISAAVLAVGWLLFVGRSRVERVQQRLAVPLDADTTYRRTMRRLDDFAADLTAITQRGSLPLYLGTILTVVVVLVAGALVTENVTFGEVKLWDRPAQLAAAALSVIAVILAARARRRLKAVLLAGVSGYGVAVLFLLHGAPDLALTQVLVETVTLIVFVLVLRRLPAYFSVRPLAASRWLRLAVGLAVGLTVGAAALVIPGARVHAPVSVDYPPEAYEFGGGENIVNVTLVDIRAWDTMGEISVLLVAATGVASLIFVRRRSATPLRTATAPDRAVWGEAVGPAGAHYVRLGRVGAAGAASDRSSQRAREWLRGGRTLAPQRRSVIFEIATRLIFHSMIIYALFMLFSGHNSPGGGFAGGLVAGIALAVRYLAGGRYELGEAAPVHPGLLLGLGLFLSAGVGLVALLLGGSVLESVIVVWEVPLIGTVKLVTSLFFDVGVFLVVVGLVLDILRSLGAEIDLHTEEAAEDPAATTSGAAGSPEANRDQQRRDRAAARLERGR